MPRNFGVSRNFFGGELFDGGEPGRPRGPLWPYFVIGFALVLIVCMARFVP